MKELSEKQLKKLEYLHRVKEYKESLSFAEYELKYIQKMKIPTYKRKFLAEASEKLYKKTIINFYVDRQLELLKCSNQIEEYKKQLDETKQNLKKLKSVKLPKGYKNFLIINVDNTKI